MATNTLKTRLNELREALDARKDTYLSKNLYERLLAWGDRLRSEAPSLRPGQELDLRRNLPGSGLSPPSGANFTWESALASARAFADKYPVPGRAGMAAAETLQFFTDCHTFSSGTLKDLENDVDEILGSLS